jgi:type III pantothenate kinase
MDLLFDLGHSRLKWAGWAHGSVQGPDAAVWRGEPPGEFCARVLAGLPPPRRVAIAAVARGELLLALQSALRQRWDCAVFTPLATARCGAVRSAYRDPSRLGFDRWAALVGAFARQPGRAAVVVDAGSAITVDGLRADGQHLGGVIFPGLRMMEEAFYARTGLAAGATDRGTDVAATTTADAVAAGAWQAVPGGIERAARAWQARLPEATLWLTGGDASALAAAMVLPLPVQHVPHLVLEGLGQVLEREGE